MRECPICHYQETIDGAIFCSECGALLNDAPNLQDKHEGNVRKSSGLSWKETAKDIDDKAKRPMWPVLAGCIAAALVLAMSIFFGISNYRQEKSEKQEMEKHFAYIENLRNLQKENYLEEALKKDNAGETVDKIYEEATKVKNDEDSSYENRINQLEALSKELMKIDEKLVAGQKEELDTNYEKVRYYTVRREFKKEYKKKFKKQLKKAAKKYPDKDFKDISVTPNLDEYLLKGERKQIDDSEDQYQADIEDHKFKTAKKNLKDYKSLMDGIINDKELSGNYSAKALLGDDEFMPEVLDFSVNAETYTDNGKKMSLDHFTLMEFVGKKATGKYIDLKSASLKIEKDDNGNEMAAYVIKFKPSKSDDYDSDRAYVLHVRSQDGTKGFTTKLKAGLTNPKDKITKAAADYMEGFAKAFNADCSEDSRSFNKMKKYLKDDSQAYKDYQNQPSKKSIQAEGIIDQDDFSVDFVGDEHKKIKVKVTCYYELGCYRTYKEICKESKENSFCHSDELSDNKNFRIVSGYVGYKKDKNDSGHAQELSNSSEFLVHEKVVQEHEVFTMKLTNTSVGKITDHENPKASVTAVLGMKYIEGSGHKYTTKDLNNLFSKESDYQDDSADYDDGDYEEDYDDYYDDDDYEEESDYVEGAASENED